MIFSTLGYLLTAWLIPWLLVTGSLYTIGCALARRYQASPGLWGWLLLFSLVPFLPEADWHMSVALPVLADVHTGVENIQVLQQATVTSAGLYLSDYLLPLLLVLYSVVTGGKLLGLLKGWRKLNALYRVSEPVGGRSHSAVKLVVSPFEHSPFVMGLLRPRIVLPHFYQAMTPGQKHTLLRHEITHIRHGDHLVVFLWQLLECFCWFNPFVKAMHGQYVRAMEKRCDGDTLRNYKLDKHSYAQTLLLSLKLCQQANTGFVAQFSAVALSLEDYKSRLLNIMQPPVINTRLLKVVLLLLMAGLLVGKYLYGPLQGSEPDWSKPLAKYWISSPYQHIHAIRNNRPHRGVDMVAPKGSQVMAANGGMVVIADGQTLSPNWGKSVLIQHSNGYQSLYAHLDSIEVKAGDWVQPKQPIGVIGETGKATGVHLHFEVIRQGQRLDPLSLVRHGDSTLDLSL